LTTACHTNKVSHERTTENTLDDRHAEAVIKVGPAGALYIIAVYLV
jgi:hypothetical protein